MAVNKPTGDKARKGAVRKRSQLETKMMGKKHWTKRSKESGSIHGPEGRRQVQRRPQGEVTEAAFSTRWNLSPSSVPDGVRSVRGLPLCHRRDRHRDLAESAVKKAIAEYEVTDPQHQKRLIAIQET